MIAGEHAEATAVLGHRLADTELGREVRHQIQGRLTSGLEPARRRQCRIEPHDGIVNGLDDEGIGGQIKPVVRTDTGEHGERLVMGFLPRHGMQTRKQLLEFAVPTPVQVVGEAVQAGKRLGYGGINPELTDATHDP